MGSFNEDMTEYRNQLEKGIIQKAYRGLMDFMSSLKNHLGAEHDEWAISGSLYFGYMDMTYFAIVTKFFKDRNLKIAIVFLHEQFRFEAWLAGANKQVQAQYWKLIKESGWDKYPLVPTTAGADAIVEHVLVDAPDFSDATALTKQIEEGVADFIMDLEELLHGHTL